MGVTTRFEMALVFKSSNLTFNLSALFECVNNYSTSFVDIQFMNFLIRHRSELHEVKQLTY